MNCLPSHLHLLSFPAIVQFILPLPFKKGPFNRISILFLPNLLVSAFKPLLAGNENNKYVRLNEITYYQIISKSIEKSRIIIFVVCSRRYFLKFIDRPH